MILWQKICTHKIMAMIWFGIENSFFFTWRLAVILLFVHSIHAFRFDIDYINMACFSPLNSWHMVVGISTKIAKYREWLICSEHFFFVKHSCTLIWKRKSRTQMVMNAKQLTNGGKERLVRVNISIIRIMHNTFLFSSPSYLLLLFIHFAEIHQNTFTHIAHLLLIQTSGGLVERSALG